MLKWERQAEKLLEVAKIHREATKIGQGLSGSFLEQRRHTKKPLGAEESLREPP